MLCQAHFSKTFTKCDMISVIPGHIYLHRFLWYPFLEDGWTPGHLWCVLGKQIQLLGLEPATIGLVNQSLNRSANQTMIHQIVDLHLNNLIIRKKNKKLKDALNTKKFYLQVHRALANVYQKIKFLNNLLTSNGRTVTFTIYKCLVYRYKYFVQSKLENL